MKDDKPKQKSAMDMAIRYLANRMRTVYEMEKHLVKKGVEPAEVEQTIERLQKYGFVDDLAFAKVYINEKSTIKHLGRKKLSHDLMRLGVDKPTIERALLDYDDDAEFAQCCYLAERLLAKRGRDLKALASVQRTLLSKGFGYDHIKRAVERSKEGTEY